MPIMRGAIAATLLACLAVWGAVPVRAQSDDPLGVGRKMLAEDNPGELWIERGKALFHQRRGPKNASLEQCDFGLARGSSKAPPPGCRATSPTPTKSWTWNRGS